MNRFHIIAICVLLISSCRPQVEQTRPIIDYVQELINDKSSYETGLLISSNSHNPSFDIAIIGESDVNDRICEHFLNYDAHDNISGILSEDQLPDFAGETFVRINTSSYSDTLEMRKRLVQATLAAMDSLVYLSPYDIDGISDKNPSKLIILSEPTAYLYGKYDADSLFNSTSCPTEIISGIDLMLDEVFEAKGSKDFNLSIVCDSIYLGTQIYEDIFDQKAKQRSLKRSKCYVYAAEQKDSLMHHLLDSYMLEYKDQSLDAVIFDVPSLNIDMLKNELANMISVMNASSLIYSPVIPDHFMICDVCKSLAEYSYQLLRKYNLFTHNIAFPQSLGYNSIVRDDKTILIPSNYVQN